MVGGGTIPAGTRRNGTVFANVVKLGKTYRDNKQKTKNVTIPRGRTIENTNPPKIAVIIPPHIADNQ
jgi:hypothetical protein